MFTDWMIRRLENKEYQVLTPEQAKVYGELTGDLASERKKNKRLVKEYNILLRDIAQRLTIKEIKEELAEADITEIPNKKAELIDLYVETFQE